jgi:hypothetical protein
LKQLINLTANNQNKRKHEVLVATLGRKEARVRVRVSGTKKGVILFEIKLCLLWTPALHSSSGKASPITLQ